jgi:hypothetical protein
MYLNYLFIAGERVAMTYMKNRKRYMGLLAAGVLQWVISGAVLAQFTASDEYALIGYEGEARDNPVAELQKQLLSGEVKLEFKEERGYFDALISRLGLNPDSQTLVFSPTSLQHKLISPETPRALYFTDNVYLGFVQNSTIVEVATIDDRFGVVFYAFDNQPETDRFFERTNQNCLVCHDTQGTMGGGVPMLMALSSVYSARNVPMQNFSGIGNVGDTTPIEDRWGGWYVTGRHGLQAHLGNILLESPDHLKTLDDFRIWNVESLKDAGYLDTDPYLRATSDIVALMVLEHQINVQNQVTYVKFKAPAVLKRRGLEEAVNANTWSELPAPAQKTLTRMLDRLVSQLVYMDAADSMSRLSGTQDFVEAFQARGPFDGQGRSLRELELSKRLFRYPLSYLVYTDDFNTLPGYAKDYVFHRLDSYLSGEVELEGRSQYSQEDRRMALEILTQTHQDFAAWRDNGRLAAR